ncbi:MAG: phosphoribosyltransferase [Candidatus Asgardarchaeia archaeon]
MEFRKVSWNDIESICFELAKRIEEDNYEADHIVVILRGGLVPASLLGDMLNIKSFYFIDIKFYEAISKTSSIPRIVKVDLDENIKGKKILLVDDVADTGKTLTVALNMLIEYEPKEIRVLTLFKKSKTTVIPNYYYANIDKWIIFPWEIRETIEEINDETILKQLGYPEKYLDSFMKKYKTR